MAESEKCENCAYWQPAKNVDGGECRRYPPILYLGTTGWTTGFVPVKAAVWCGDWKKK